MFKNSPQSEDMLFFSVVDCHLYCAASEVERWLTFYGTALLLISKVGRLGVVEIDLPPFQHYIKSKPGPREQ